MYFPADLLRRNIDVWYWWQFDNTNQIWLKYNMTSVALYDINSSTELH